MRPKTDSRENPRDSVRGFSRIRREVGLLERLFELLTFYAPPHCQVLNAYSNDRSGHWSSREAWPDKGRKMNSKSLPRKLMTQQEAAMYFGVSVRTVRRWQAEGLITAYRVGRRGIRIDADTLDGALRCTA